MGDRRCSLSFLPRQPIPKPRSATSRCFSFSIPFSPFFPVLATIQSTDTRLSLDPGLLCGPAWLEVNNDTTTQVLERSSLGSDRLHSGTSPLPAHLFTIGEPLVQVVVARRLENVCSTYRLILPADGAYGTWIERTLLLLIRFAPSWQPINRPDST